MEISGLYDIYWSNIMKFKNSLKKGVLKLRI